MMLITPIILGALIGTGMALLFGQPQFLMRDALLGIIGALVLRVISWLVLESRGDSLLNGFTFVGILSSVVGAAVAVYAAKFFPPEKHDTKI